MEGVFPLFPIHTIYPNYQTYLVEINLCDNSRFIQVFTGIKYENENGVVVEKHLL